MVASIAAVSDGAYAYDWAVLFHYVILRLEFRFRQLNQPLSAVAYPPFVCGAAAAMAALSLAPVT